MHLPGSPSPSLPLVFIARDFNVPARDTIASVEEELASILRIYEPERDSPGQGHVFQIVKGKIAEADCVVTFVNRNNINVAFELGYALGLRKKVILVEKEETERPREYWIKDCFLKSYLWPPITDYGDLVTLLEDDSFIPLPVTVPGRGDGRLLLCPGRGEGRSIVKQIRSRHPDLTWIEGSAGRTVDDLLALHSFSELVWVVTTDRPEGDSGDGAANTCNAVFAGYLAALGVTPRIFVYGGRDLSDLKDWVQPVSSAADINERLGAAGRGAFATPPGPRSAAGRAEASADSGLAATLAEYFSDPEVFADIAHSFAFPVDGASTPLARWTALIGHCATAGELGRLKAEVLERARCEDRLDGGLRERALAAGLLRPRGEPPAREVAGAEWALRSRISGELESIRPVTFDLPWASSAREESDPVTVFARFALVLTWGPAPPVPPEVHAIQAWVQTASGGHEAVLRRAIEAGWLSARLEWAEPHLGEAVGAYALVADCERDPAGGVAMVRWMLDHLHRLGPSRRQILGLVLRWWPPGCAAAVAWQAETLGTDPRGIAPGRARDVLLQLTRCDALFAQLGIAPWADPALAVPGTRPGCAPAAAAGPDGALAPSVAWALRSGQERYVPYVLESLGEARTGVYSEMLARVSSREAQAALARALRRLAQDAADEPVLPAGAWGDAVRASLPRYGPGARRRLEAPAVAAHWLEIVDLPYGDDDLRALAVLFREGAGLGARARDRLALEPALPRVWAALGASRRPFIHQLTDAQLGEPNVAALVRELRAHPPADPAERADADLLVARHDARCAAR